VYAITCKKNGKKYIGSSIKCERRWYEHHSHLVRGNHHCRHLQLAWNKYGEENFYFSIVAMCCPTKEDLLAEEQKQLDAVPIELRYNSSQTASSPLGVRWTEEAKMHQSQRKKGCKYPNRKRNILSEEHKKRISESLLGKKQSYESIKKSAEKRRGRKISEETRLRLSESHKGKTLSEESRTKLSNSIKGVQRKKRVRLYAKDVDDVRSQYAAGGVTMQKLADCFGVCLTTIHDIIHRKGSWKYASDRLSTSI
jgi:group I intron endonuclease